MISMSRIELESYDVMNVKLNLESSTIAAVIVRDDHCACNTGMNLSEYIPNQMCLDLDIWTLGW